MTCALLVCAFAVIAAPAQDDARVSARLSPASAGIGEPVMLEVSVEGASGTIDITMPNLPPGLVITGTQDFTEMHLSIPGGRRQTRRREFAMYATGAGRYRIPPITVTIGRRTLRTNALELVITGVGAPRSVESNTETWLRAAMSPETVYVGQQATLTVEAGFSEEVRTRLTRPPVFETPSPTGFWVQDVPGGVQSRLRAVDDQIVETYTLRRAYFPLSPGRYALAPARAVIDVREGFLFAPETREIRSGSPKITVLSLPDAERPRDFKGAVGSYEIRASVQPDTVGAGEAAQITVEITGNGNVKAAPQPVFPTIAGVEQFTPTEDADVVFNGATVGGTKRFQWVIIPNRHGEVEIPPIAYSFFDPQARVYRTVRTDPVKLVVTPAAALADEAAATAALHAIRTRPSRPSLSWVRTREFLLAQAIPLLIVLGLLFARTRRGRSPTASLLMEVRSIRTAGGSFAEFLRAVDAVVRKAAAERVGDAAIRTAEVRALAAALRSIGVDDVVAARVVAFIERVETQRFAPTGAEAAERESLLREAEELVRALAAGIRSGRASIVVALMVLSQVQSPTFDRGVELYRNGRFAQAAVEFEQAVKADTTDIAAWSNLGNAHYRAGNRGRAIWAWARAAREAPRDAALTRDLQAAGAVEVLRTRPPLSVRPVEWYLLAAIAWWLACAIAGAAIVRRRRGWFSWTLPAIAIMTIGIAIGIVADGRAYAVALEEETRLYGDPTIHSPVVRRIQAGAGLDIIEERGEWLRVRTIAHAEGWVESDAVGRL